MARRLYGPEWNKRRRQAWERDEHKCTNCGDPVGIKKCHIDHIIELSRGGTNMLENLRTLCPTCHCLRKEMSHRGMTAKALQKGWIPPDWRKLVW